MSLSVIIPMRNEEAFVARCLDSLLAQVEKRDDVEILCADGASTDRTRAVVLRYVERDPRVRLIDNPGKIAPSGMNQAIRQARGEVIIRCDCHCEYAPDYIENCLEVLERTGADNVGGYWTIRPGNDSRIGRAIATATSSRFGVGGSIYRTGGGEQEVDTVPFGCFRREAFQRFGLYDERLVRNQDIELNSRIRRGGGKIIISPKINATYFNRSTFSGLRQQAFNNGLWNPYTIWITGGGLRIRHFVPLVFVLSLLILTVAGFEWRIAWWGLAAELLVYFGAGLVMAIRGQRDPPASVFLTLLAFFQLHLSYGVGSLWGVLTAPFKFGLSRRHQPGQALADRRD